MSFVSAQFFIFLSVVFIAYWLMGSRFKVPLLCAASYCFYAMFDWRYLAVLVLLTILNFVCGNKISGSVSPTSKKRWLVISIVGSVGALGYLKYFNFFTDSLAVILTSIGFHISPLTHKIILPVGVSYYVFQMLTYTLDIYRQQIQPAPSILNFATYSSFFAHIVAGPITRARQFLPQLERERRFHWADIQWGLTRFLFGYFKKVFMADTLAFYLVDPVFKSPEIYRTGILWLAALGYFVQIYADFSGYSSMAIGSARLLGLKLQENFAFPYLSKNIAEFWRRWHITLSRWLRDYLWWSLASNIPFRGNFIVMLKAQTALFLVFLICGLWHGASWIFVLWGALHGVYIVTYESWHRRHGQRDEKRQAPTMVKIGLAWLTTQLAICFSWIVFRADNVKNLMSYLKGLVTATGTESLQLPWIVWAALGAIVIDHLMGWLHETRPAINQQHALLRGMIYTAMIVLLFHTQPEQISPFIYFQF